MAQAYLDNSATTRPCGEAIAAMTECLREGWYNPSAVYGPSVEVFKALRLEVDELLRHSCALELENAGCITL